MLKKILLGVVIFLLFTLLAKNTASYDSPHTYSQLPKEVILSEYDIELNDWINRLAKCESGNNPSAINHYDGGSRSVGYVQYKDDTWRRYNDKFGLPYTAEDIWSKEAQIEVTKEVIKNETNGYKNWYNCTTKLGVGLPPKQP